MCVMTMRASLSRLASLDEPRPRVRIPWVELSCLPCGEVAGYIEDRRVVRSVYQGGILLERGRPPRDATSVSTACGRDMGNADHVRSQAAAPAARAAITRAALTGAALRREQR